jgi:hypothetical protein
MDPTWQFAEEARDFWTFMTDARCCVVQPIRPLLSQPIHLSFSPKSAPTRGAGGITSLAGAAAVLLAVAAPANADSVPAERACNLSENARATRASGGQSDHCLLIKVGPE